MLTTHLLMLLAAPLAAHSQGVRAHVEAAPVAVVRGTFTIAHNAAEGPAAAGACDETEAALTALGLPFDEVTEEQVEAEGLAGRRVAVFPYSADWSDQEAQQAAAFAQGGGLLLCFYTVPKALEPVLGITVAGYVRADYPGQLAAWRCQPEALPGCPAQVPQDSGNRADLTPAAGGQVIATWADLKGKDTKLPAVVLSSNGLYAAHLLRAPAEERRAFLLAAIGQLLPEVWHPAVEAAIGKVGAFDDVPSLQALRFAAGVDRPAVEAVGAAEDLVRQATARLKTDPPGALALAQQARARAEEAYCTLAPSRPDELRGVWIGGVEGLDWDAVMKTLQQAGFNAVFPNMCTANAAYYDSAVLPRVGKRDELALCLKAARKRGIQVHVWRINWALLDGTDEGRRAAVAAGRTQARADGTPMEADPSTDHVPWLCPSQDENRALERAAMLELTQKYHPDGIHFDYMRFPSKDYCFCPACRQRFARETGLTVAHWPADCVEGGPLQAQFRQWRRDLQTSLVRDIAEASRRADPHVMISLAARSGVDWAPENDGQDWPTWAQRRYLDFLCPMDYTGDVEQLKTLLLAQEQAVAGAVPIYAGLGVTYNDTLSSAPRISRQVYVARECGADGFVVFCWNPALERALAPLHLGVTATAGTALPHGGPSVGFTFPEVQAGAPPRSYLADQPVHIAARLKAATETSEVTVSCSVERLQGEALEPPTSTTVRGSHDFALEATFAVGAYRVAVRSVPKGSGGAAHGFITRSLPFRCVTAADLRAAGPATGPPTFQGTGIAVGVLANGVGSDAMLQALQAARGIEALPVASAALTTTFPCQVLVVTPRRGDLPAYAQSVDDLRVFVAGGGGLLLVGDAIGAADHPAFSPEAPRVTAEAGPTTATITREEHPIAEGLLGAVLDRTFSSRVELRPGPRDAVIAVDADGRPVIVAGAYRKGRYVAWGLPLGVGPDGREAAPTGAELQLLVQAIVWLWPR